ncbi:polysaccharide deacetylase family protein, partial [uncultured Thiodictyon sp.]|uniref:polysaccharide deacetylase family protein n=1 Tax=uncultured Thiodictyon sp. TaxID=1846217 RepID=UPI0025F7E9B7
MTILKNSSALPRAGDMVSRQWQRWLTALSLDRIARHWLGGRGLIVMLHRIAAEPGAWRGNPGLWITLQQLRGIIVTLRDEGYEWMSLSDALTRPASRHQPRFACLTFDDGYRDNYELALPLLRDWGIPATIYVTTGFVEGTVPDWRHGLESIIAQHPVLELRLQQQQERFSTAGPGEKDSVYRQVCDRLSAAKPVTRAQALCQLAQDYGVDFDHSSLDQMLTVPMLRQFAASGLIELGARLFVRSFSSTTSRHFSPGEPAKVKRNEHRTSNIEHPTSNETGTIRFSVRRSMFSVRCLS